MKNKIKLGIGVVLVTVVIAAVILGNSRFNKGSFFNILKPDLLIQSVTFRQETNGDIMARIVVKNAGLVNVTSTENHPVDIKDSGSNWPLGLGLGSYAFGPENCVDRRSGFSASCLPWTLEPGHTLTTDKAVDRWGRRDVHGSGFLYEPTGRVRLEIDSNNLFDESNERNNVIIREIPASFFSWRPATR